MLHRLRNMTADHAYLVNGEHFAAGATISVDLAKVPEWCGIWRGLRLGIVVDLDAEPEPEPVPVREYEVHEPVAEDVPRFARGRRNRKG